MGDTQPDKRGGIQDARDRLTRAPSKFLAPVHVDPIADRVQPGLLMALFSGWGLE